MKSLCFLAGLSLLPLTSIAEDKLIHYKWSPQREVLAEERIIDGQFGLVGSSDKATENRSFHLAKDEDGSNILKFKFTGTGNRIEVTENYATQQLVDQLGVGAEELADLATITDVYGLQSVGDYGDTISYSWKTLFPEEMNENHRGIIAQWHGRPDRTMVRSPEGEITVLSLDAFKALSKKAQWKSFKDNEGGIRGLDPETGEDTGWRVEGSAGGPIGTISVADGHLCATFKNDSGALSTNKRPKMKASVARPKNSDALRSIEMVHKRPLSEVPLNQWIDFKVVIQYTQYNWPEDGVKVPGAVKYYINGELVADWKGNIGKNDYLGPYFKMGIYKPGDDGLEVWHKNYKREILKRVNAKSKLILDKTRT